MDTLLEVVVGLIAVGVVWKLRVPERVIIIGIVAVAALIALNIVVG